MAPLVPHPAAWMWVVAGLLCAGVALRVWLLSTSVYPLGTLDADEAVVGLMARHVPEELPAFFWGQSYGGSQEAVLAAALFRLLGPTGLALKLVPVLLAAVSAWLVWRIGRRTVGEPGAALGGAIFWAAPAAFVWWSTKERGHYWVTLLLGLAAVLLILRLAQLEEAPPGSTPVRRFFRGWLSQTLTLGFVAGAGWWASANVVYLVAPAVVWLVVREPRLLRRLWAALPTALLGAAPWIVANARRGWPSLSPRFGGQPEPNGYVDHLGAFFAGGLPRALSLRVPMDPGWVSPVLGPLLYALALAGFGWLLLHRPEGVGPLLAVGAAYPFLFALSPLSWWVWEPRYLLFLSPVVALLLARFLVGLRPAPLAGALGAGVVLALSCGGLVLMGVGGQPFPLDDLERTLEARGVEHVFTDYWVAYPLTFHSEERIVATPYARGVRYEPFDRAVRESARPAYVFPQGMRNPELRFVRALRDRGIGFERLEVDGFLSGLAVYLPAERVLPEQVEIGRRPSPSPSAAPRPQ